MNPPRSFRVADDLWRAALEAAHAEGRTLSDVITDSLRRYVQRSARKATKD